MRLPWLLGLCLCLTLAGCGQKGDLYLPPIPDDAADAPTPDR